jgi:hypothetical protein
MTSGSHHPGPSSTSGRTQVMKLFFERSLESSGSPVAYLPSFARATKSLAWWSSAPRSTPGRTLSVLGDKIGPLANPFPSSLLSRHCSAPTAVVRSPWRTRASSRLCSYASLPCSRFPVIETVRGNGFCSVDLGNTSSTAGFAVDQSPPRLGQTVAKLTVWTIPYRSAFVKHRIASWFTG